MNILLTPVKWQHTLRYLDDGVIFYENFEEHLRRVESVSQQIQKVERTLKRDKCIFLVQRNRLFWLNDFAHMSAYHYKDN